MLLSGPDFILSGPVTNSSGALDSRYGDFLSCPHKLVALQQYV